MNKEPDKQIITEEEVRYVARLSRLRLDDEQTRIFQKQLFDILGYIAQLNEVDTEGVLPTTHALSSMKNVFREDKPGGSLRPEEALKNAPATKGDLFKVPKVI